MENIHAHVTVQMVNEHLIPHARLIVSNFWDTQITLYMFQKSLFLIMFLFSFTINYLLSLLILLHFLFLLFNFQQDPANETKRSWIWDTLGIFLIFMILASELFKKLFLHHLIFPYSVNAESNINWGSKKYRNDHLLKKHVIVRGILLTSLIENLYKTVWRICILVLGCKGLSSHAVKNWCVSTFKLKVHTLIFFAAHLRDPCVIC